MLNWEFFELKTKEVEFSASGSVLGMALPIENTKSLIGLPVMIGENKIGEVIGVSIVSRLNSSNIVSVRCILIEAEIEALLCSPSS